MLSCPAYFAKVDAPTDEVPSVWRAVAEPPEHAEFHRVEPPIPDEDAVVVVQPFRVIATGRKYERGEKLRRDDPVVLANTGAFEIVTPLAS